MNGPPTHSIAVTVVAAALAVAPTQAHADRILRAEVTVNAPVA